MRLKSTFVAAALSIVLMAGIARAQAPPQKDVAPASESATQPSHVRIGGTVRGAKLIHQVAPIYPASAKRNHVEGTVVLHGVVTKDGSVDQLRVVSGPVALTDVAVAAVKQWRYEPATFQDKPVEMATTVSIVFTFHRPEPPAAQALIRP